jgi:hypothetical protein
MAFQSQFVIVQIKDFQNREEGTTQEGRTDTKKEKENDATQ